MADHAELVKEMVELEKLPSQERLKLAKKRRQSQLKKYVEHEKKADKQERQANKRKSKAHSVMHSSKPLSLPAEKKTKQSKIRFDKGIMLLEAAARNDVTEVKDLLEDGVNPDVANEDGLTALHQCCIDDSEDMLLLLLQHGANVNSRDSELWTPLHAASTCAHLRICQHLLRHSADLLAVNAEGNMPYDICEDEATLEFIETEMANQGITQELIDETRLSTEKSMLEDLKEYEKEGNELSSWKDSTGASLLHIASANGYYDVASYLLTKRLDVNAIDSENWTPAMAAACWGQVPVLELLAKNGADLDVKTKDNKSLVDLVDDVEVKEQITEIKQEIKVNLERFRRANSDVKRRSSTNIRSGGSVNSGSSAIYNSNTSLTDRNSFSSSVRRHSMREKHRLSMREARDEAKYRIAINTEDGDSSPPSSPDERPPSQDGAVSMPVTNIDDLEVTVSDNNVTTIHINEPPQPVETKPSQPEPVPPVPAQPEKTKLVATISIGGTESTEPASDPEALSTEATTPSHMNGGDRNSNGNSASVKVGILKHSTDNASSGDTAENNSQFQQHNNPSSNKNPVLLTHDPPKRKYTSYGQPVGNVHAGEQKASKSCCVIS